MGLVVDSFEAFHRDVGVELGGGHAGVAEEFLDDTQVGAAFEQVGGGGVAQAVRAQVGRSGDGRDDLVHHGAGLALVEAAAALAEQQCPAGMFVDQGRAARAEPGVQRGVGGAAEGYRSFLVALAEDTDECALPIDVVDVEATQLDRKSVV